MQFLKKSSVCFHHHSLKQQLNITWNQYLDWYSNILLGTALFQLTQPWSQSKLIFSPLPCHHLRCVNQESNNWHELEIQQRNIPKHLIKSIFHTTHPHMKPVIAILTSISIQKYFSPTKLRDLRLLTLRSRGHTVSGWMWTMQQ